jgi:hypothetical protein
MTDFVRAERAFHRARSSILSTNAKSSLAAPTRHSTEVLRRRSRWRRAIRRIRESRRARDHGRALLKPGSIGGETIGKLTQIGEMPAIAPARAAELKGATGPTVTLLQRAVESMRRTADPTRIAWFEARLGDVCYRTGCPASRAALAALSLYACSARARRSRRIRPRRAACGCAGSLRSARLPSHRARRLFDLGRPGSSGTSAAAERYAAGEGWCKAGENQAARASVFYAERLGKEPRTPST